MRSKLGDKLLSLCSVVSLLIQTLIPFTSILSVNPVLAAAPLQATVKFDSSKHLFSINVNTGDAGVNDSVDYLLVYRTNTQNNAIKGTSDKSNQNFQRDILAGTCSTGGTCVYDTVIRGIAKFEVSSQNWITAIKFSIDDGKLKVKQEYTPASLDLNDAENYWLQQGTDLSPTPTVTSAVTPTPTATIAATVTPTPTVIEHGQILDGAATQKLSSLKTDGHVNTTVVKSFSCRADSLNGCLITDKTDYAPASVAVITGYGFGPNTQYSLVISTDGLNQTYTITTDNQGSFTYSYTLYTEVHKLYTVQLKDVSGQVVATTTFTDSASSTQTLTGVACVGDQPSAPNNLNCTANDISLASVSNITINGHGCRYPGDTVNFTANWQVQSTATSRYNVGLWFATNGQSSALHGTCSATSLPSSPAPFFDNGGTDKCGDIHSGSTGTLSITQTAICNPDSNGFLKLPYCSTWQENENNVPACNIPTDTVPGAPSKCSCNNGFEVPITVPPSIEVVKSLVPTNDSGLFNLQVNGTTDATNVGNTGTTGKQSANVGSNTIGETAGTNTSLGNYASAVSCVLRGTQTPVFTSGSNPWTLSVANGQDILCTITNNRNNGTLTVNKVVVPSNDTGKFNLQIDGSTAGTGANVGNGGTTGAIVSTIGSHTVGETAGTGTTLGNYTAAITGDCASNGSITLAAGDVKVCTITNTRQTGSVKVNKMLDANGTGIFVANNPGSFTWSLDGSGTNAMGSTVSGVNTGSHSVNESTITNYHFVGWYSTGSNTNSCTNPTATTLPVSITVSNGQTTDITLCNARDTGTLKIVKNTTGGDGTFNYTVTGPTASTPSIVTSGGIGNTGNMTVATGTYTVSETIPTHWSLTSSSCTDGTNIFSTSGFFSIAVGKTVTCTFNNTKLANIVINKKALGGDGTFGYTTTGGLSPSTFNITTITGTGSQSFNDINPGTYGVSENTPPAGWSLTSATCDNSNNPSAITINAGTTVTCTFTNTKLPTLKVIKSVTNDDNGSATASSFTVHVKSSGTDVNGSPQAGSATGTTYTLNPGTYSVSENDPTSLGYTLTGITGACNSDGSVTLSAGQNKTCTVTNNDNTPHLTLVKDVNNENGGTAAASAWTLSATAEDRSFSGAGPTVGPNAVMADETYTLSESGGPSGYTASDWNCDGGTMNENKTTVTLALGESATCAITNSDIQPELTVTKVVVGGSAVVSDFNLFVGETQVTSGVQNGFNADTYTVSEIGDQTSNYTASFNGDCDPQGSVILNIGDVKSCTITNTIKRGTITVTKHTDPQGLDQSFTFDLGGISTDSANLADGQSHNFTNLLPGNYSLTELVPDGWDLTNAVCNDQNYTNGGTLNLAPGGSINCSFTNTKLSKVIVTKYQDDNANGVDDNETGLPNWQINLGKSTQTTGNDGTTTFNNVLSGEYSLSENFPEEGNWIQSNISCFNGKKSVGYNENGYLVELGAGQTIKCFIGNYQKGHIVVTKEIQNPDGKPQTNGDTTTFDFTVSGSTDSASLGDGQSHNFEVKPGSHTVQETTNNNYDFLGCTSDGESFKTLQVTSGSTFYVTCVNKQKQGKITGFKWNDADANGQFEQGESKLSGWTIFAEQDSNGILDNGEPSTTTDNNGNYTLSLNPGSYSICEIMKSGWTPTYPKTTTPNCQSVTLGSNETYDGNLNFGNKFIPPELQISKSNNATGDFSTGSSVGYTIILKALQNSVHNLSVVDLLPQGFIFRAGSATATSSNNTKGTNGVLTLPSQPSYHSPGTWTFPSNYTLDVGEVLTLTLTADINGSVLPGTYKDVAWAKGTQSESASSTQVLALAQPTGYVSTNFVGTQVKIVADQQNYTNANISSQGQVLGASTTNLPATGGRTIWIILAGILTLFGVLLVTMGLFIRKKLFKKVGKVAGGLAAALIFAYIFLNPSGVHAANLSIRLEQPVSPTRLNNFNVIFVVLDLSNNPQPITVQCLYKKSLGDPWTQYGSNIAVSAGGNTGNCAATSGFVNNDGQTYYFSSTANNGSETASSESEGLISVDYKISGPGTPSNYSKQQIDSCHYKIGFKTANDSKTTRVEIYRSTSTSFAVDPSTRAGTVTIGPNLDGSFTDTVPDCNKYWYYVIRAYDAASNGSGVIGDSVTTTITTVITTPSAGGGAIFVQGVSLPGGPGGAAGGNILGTETQQGTQAGQVMGEATPSGKPEIVNVTESPIKKIINQVINHKKRNLVILLILIIAGATLYYVTKKRNQEPQV